MSGEPEAQDSEVSTGGLTLALVGYTLLFAGKLTTYFVTGIGVMYAESLHSLADMMISGFLLLAALWSRKPADDNYRFGYGRAQNVAALVAATVFISFTSLEAFRQGISKLLGVESEYSNLSLAIGVTVVAIVISGLPLIRIWWGKERGAATSAQLVESINDEVALLAALVGILLIGRGIPIADGIASMVVGAVIAVNAAVLWWQNARSLMGHSPGADFYRRVEDTSLSVAGVKAVHDLRAEYVGGKIHMGMHVEVARGTPIEEADRVAGDVHDKIGKTVRHVNCVIHVEPEGDSSSAGPVSFPDEAGRRRS